VLEKQSTEIRWQTNVIFRFPTIKNHHFLTVRGDHRTHSQPHNDTWNFELSKINNGGRS